MGSQSRSCLDQYLYYSHTYSTAGFQMQYFHIGNLCMVHGLRVYLFWGTLTAFIPQNIGRPSNYNTYTPTVLQKVSYMAERVVGTGLFGVVYQVC